MTVWQCPMCEEQEEIREDVLCAGHVRWTCPHCETEWIIDTQYHQVEDEADE